MIMKKIGIMFIAFLFITFLAGAAFAGDMKGEKGAYQSMDTIRASEFIGKDVNNQQGENIGSISDILIDQRGNAQYFIISKGGLMGMGADLIPVPFKAKNFSFQDDAVTLTMDKQKWDEAPTFSSGEWDTIGDQGFRDKVHGYYGIEKDKDYKEYKKEEHKQQ
jgi:sporulation protein YlmC with PRC-barrel domain